MAYLRFNSTVDMRTFPGYSFAAIASGTSVTSSTSVEVSYDSYRHYLAGSGFADFQNNLPTIGTVNSWSFGWMSTGGPDIDVFYEEWLLSDISVPAAQFSDALLNDTIVDLLPSLLAGNDTIAAQSSSYLLGYNGDDILQGSWYADTLNGGAGADSMRGGTGHDIYVVDNNSDEVVENTDEGIDLVQSSVDYVLGSNIENLTLTGTSAIDGIGNSGNNILTGNAAANYLMGFNGDDSIDGGAGADTMKGGGGNDVYYRDHADDLVHEFADSGWDVVFSSVTYGLYGHIEVLELTGSANINGYGNSLSNNIYGNAGANVLNGGTGADNMFGRGGNDRYYVDNASDITWEGVDQGTDYVFSTITFRLDSNVEHLNLVGSAAINATGNELNNTINGNSANNVLYGGLGTDTLRGGLGNDTYYRDNAGDAVVEAEGQGTDLVYSHVSYGLGANLENLILDGVNAINGHGNALGNSITGNAAANTINGNDGNDELRGLGGNDTINGDNGADSLNGGTGNDVMNGGAGVDLFLFDTALDAATNVDTIISYSIADDTFQLDNDIFSAAGSIGTLAAGAFRAGAAAADADDRIIYDSATGRIYYDADGNGAGAQVLFAQVNAGTSLTSGDFLIVG